MYKLKTIVLVWLALGVSVTYARTEETVRVDEISRKFHQVYYYNNALWAKKTTWLGVITQQTPQDSWVMQEIINEVGPDFVIETGTYKGGGALFYASVLEGMNSDGKVITVDIEDQIDRKALNLPLFRKRVEFIRGDSVGPGTIDTIAKKVKGCKVIVTLDSDHSKEHVLKELRSYAPLVSVGSYLVVQDTNINGHPVLPDYGPGPWEAVEEFLQNNDTFVIDHSREKFMVTFYPSGYLKRVK